MTRTTGLTAQSIKQRASALGFDLCGVAPVVSFPELEHLPDWLARGYAGNMAYLHRTAQTRAGVSCWLPGAQSVICVACAYHTESAPEAEGAEAGQGRIARYARGCDYHGNMEARLLELLAWMRQTHPEPFDARVGVDDAPCQERVYAAYAGLGWIGKNTCLINGVYGSFVVLGEIVTTLGLEVDGPDLDQCGSCQRCLDACPTGALVGPRELDARRCLCYLTIEVKRDIPIEQRPGLGTQIFGCDICQDVCPHNAGLPTTADAAWRTRPGLEAPVLTVWWAMSDEQLAALIAGTPLERRGVRGVRRNLAVVMGNSGLSSCADALRVVRSDAPSITDPVVRTHMDWALARLACRQA